MKALLLLLAGLAAATSAWTGKVIRVLDGDTYDVLNGREVVRIRLYGVDAPEKTQDFGQVAKTFGGRIFGRQVEVAPIDTDRYGRTIGLITVAGERKAFNQVLLEEGLAWVYTAYCKEAWCTVWSRLEGEAKAARKGLWADARPEPPWQFRRR
ncbi:MAG: thermonuclease family protein [Planctomycetes bacterium]|nr:thermonuclease family protein [Planctomycetota bacterium]